MDHSFHTKDFHVLICTTLEVIISWEIQICTIKYAKAVDVIVKRIDNKTIMKHLFHELKSLHLSDRRLFFEYKSTPVE
jgi:hypothetical protein